MQTSTWSLSRSIVAGSKDSSGVAIHRRVVDENNLGCGILLVAAHCCRIMLLFGTLVDSVLQIGDCVVANGLAVRTTRRPDILAGVDIASVCFADVCGGGKGSGND